MTEFLKSLPKSPTAKRPLYVNRSVSDELSVELGEKGWVVTDTRLIADPVKRIEAMLDGAVFGSINLGLDDLKSLEFAAKIYGIANRKEADRPKEEKKGDVKIEDLLKFGKKRDENVDGLINPTKRNTYKPKPTKDLKPKKRKLSGFVLDTKVAKLRKQHKHEEADRILEEAGKKMT